MNRGNGVDFDRLNHLDMLRAVASFLVLAGHLRSYLFQSYGELDPQSVGVIWKLFYFSTSLGHQAVIVFFALSGYLVGGKAMGDLLGGQFSWSRYALRRLSRLWLVIVPALSITLLFDNIGILLTQGRGYDGQYLALYALGPSNVVPLNHGIVAFFGNLLFLQTISVPIFGTNSPMWSLANEFWYYVVIPLILWIVLPNGGWVWRALGLTVLIVLCGWLPRSFLEGGVIWAAGAVVAWLSMRPPFASALKRIWARVAAPIVLGTAIILARIPESGMNDVLLGLCVCLTLPVIANLPRAGWLYRVVGRGGSEISYSLYLSHFPLLTLVVLAGFAPVRYPPGASGAFLYLGLLCLALIWGALFWWCFERHTNKVYAFLVKVSVGRR